MGRPARRVLQRLSRPLLALAALAIILAPAAGADGAGPTNFRSRVDKLVPEVQGARVEVLGSDAFLQVTAAPGIRVQVPGYDGEPYLRIDSDGAVWRNRRSPARYVNDSRTGAVKVPDDLGDSNDPDWEKVGTNGTVAWHDHRIHWMTKETPATGRTGLVQRWEVPLTIDGTEVTVYGSLYRHGNTLPWSALLALALALGLVLLVRREARPIVSTMLLSTGALALLTTLLIRAGDPPGAGTSPIPLVLALLSLGCALVARFSAGHNRTLQLVTTLGAAALLIGWLVPVVGAFWMPYVPAAAPAVLVRLLVALVGAGAVGCAVAVAWDPNTLER